VLEDLQAEGRIEMDGHRASAVYRLVRPAGATAETAETAKTAETGDR
jgi:hypothetical protein